MALSDLMAVCEEKTIKKGEKLITTDEQNKHVYFLLSGSVEISQNDHKEVVSAHAVIGLTSVFLIAKANQNAVVKQTAVVLKTSRNKLYRMMALHPSLAMAILHEISFMAQK